MLLDPKWNDTLAAIEKTPPQFGPQPWHSRGYLDARPVIWSLRNRPEQWERRNVTGYDDNYCIMYHKPSRHSFYETGWGLQSASCSCTGHPARGGRFSFAQRWQVRAAFRHWRRTWGRQQRLAEISKINEQFTAHFVEHAA